MFAAFSFEYGSVNKELQAQLAGKEEENSKLKLSIKELRKVMVDQARAAMAPAVTKTLNATDGNHLIEPRRRRSGSISSKDHPEKPYNEIATIIEVAKFRDLQEKYDILRRDQEDLFLLLLEQEAENKRLKDQWTETCTN